MNIKLKCDDDRYYIVSRNDATYSDVGVFWDKETDKYSPCYLNDGEPFSATNRYQWFDTAEEAAESLCRKIDNFNFGIDDEDKIK